MKGWWLTRQEQEKWILYSKNYSKKFLLCFLNRIIYSLLGHENVISWKEQKTEHKF